MKKPYNWDTPRVDVWLNQGSVRRTSRPAGASASFRGPVGLQLDSPRDIFSNVGLTSIISRVKDTQP
jgi:hypothetical protein